MPLGPSEPPGWDLPGCPPEVVGVAADDRGDPGPPAGFLRTCYACSIAPAQGTRVPAPSAARLHARGMGVERDVAAIVSAHERSRIRNQRRSPCQDVACLRWVHPFTRTLSHPAAPPGRLGTRVPTAQSPCAVPTGCASHPPPVCNAARSFGTPGVGLTRMPHRGGRGRLCRTAEFLPRAPYGRSAPRLRNALALRRASLPSVGPCVRRSAAPERA
ncbi:hypothetical protein COCNU_scaffold068551G000020 [Cocos nucifera]|nr:hypothetical protein [Cocos nucifera]